MFFSYTLFFLICNNIRKLKNLEKLDQQNTCACRRVPSFRQFLNENSEISVCQVKLNCYPFLLCKVHALKFVHTRELMVDETRQKLGLLALCTSRSLWAEPRWIHAVADDGLVMNSVANRELRTEKILPIPEVLCTLTSLGGGVFKKFQSPGLPSLPHTS